MSDNFDDWLEHGEHLGYTGTDFHNFVKEQEQAFVDREERALRRAQERENLLKSQDEERECKKALSAQTELEHQRALSDIKQKQIILHREVKERELMLQRKA